MKTAIKRKPKAPAALAESATPTSPADDYLTKQQLARRLDRGIRTLERWMHDGFLPYYKFRGTIYFKWAEVDRDISRHRLLRT